MNRSTSVACALRLASFLLASAGCQSTLIAGYEDGGPHPSASTGSTGSTTGAASTTGPAFGSSTGAVPSTGGTSAGVNGTGSGTGNGTTGGTSTGDAGPCLPNSSECSSNDRCCSGSCDNVCDQAFGKPCFADGDCGSYNCVNDLCACSQPTNFPLSSCATDEDCCGGVCTHYVDQGDQTGLCCNDLGASCNGTVDCCDENCVDGQCLCLPTGSPCYSFINGCCSGICENETCKVNRGGVCEAPIDCVTENCDGGICDCAISSAPCAAASDCCSGFNCGSSICCGDPGTACGPGVQCCGVCTNGTCACVPPGPDNRCNGNSLSCCPGGSCMLSFPSVGIFTCCQLNAQPCFSFDECCTAFCAPDNTCACMPDGGECGPIGDYSPLGSAACCSGVCGDAGACL